MFFPQEQLIGLPYNLDNSFYTTWLYGSENGSCKSNDYYLRVSRQFCFIFMESMHNLSNAQDRFRTTMLKNNSIDETRPTLSTTLILCKNFTPEVSIVLSRKTKLSGLLETRFSLHVLGSSYFFSLALWRVSTPRNNHATMIMLRCASLIL